MASHLNNIAKYRKLRKLSQQELAEKVGAHAITISNLERGHTALTEDWLSRLSEALQVEEGALLVMERPQRVFVAGELSRDGVLAWPEEDGKALAIADRPTPIGADVPIWVVVKDDSLYPAFQALDVVRVVPLLENDPKEVQWAVGRLCVVMFDDNQTSVGYLQRGYSGEFSVAPVAGPARKGIGLKPKIIMVIDKAIYQPDFPDRPALGKIGAKTPPKDI
ncbi:helix-turn-helix transcriptional regulator [Bradyrhizobium sp. BRP56]|uniref:helix-turn-helix domain-containing protein n=1 Tax=Bradyrhizobium sp. BRP56 TaxID=2793819 RepID=UPI001CD744AE|nr:helix-turn-helix transcriptional regulator [Bradyrhizobium sp. BRP56]MCA1398660.1 helix-turn-helix transcriptional regulator [Bradyrhizobium sp. BRP56]